MEGTTLGAYRLDRELGAGGMGKVYAAEVERRDLGLDPGTRVAVKVVHRHLLETQGFFRRFLREAEIGASIRHENVVATYGADAAAVGGVQHHFLVMEFVEGQTLRELLGELERVPEELCRHIGREVAKGLAAIHAAGVVHRDMKPENVIISRCTAPGHDHVAERPGAQRRVSEGNVHLNCDHVVKVMDLGVARLQDEAMRLSQTGAFVGSLHYAAPECFSEGGKHVDGRADLHALGLVLYELACGVNPYYAESIPETLKRVLHETPRRLGDVNPQLSPFFEEVVHCLLAKKPEDRFADAAALLAALDDGEESAWWTLRAKAIRAETHRPLRRIRIPRETAVYGREAELALLRARFACATKGDGQVVLLEGEAGIGKSRLVDELVGRLQHDGEDIHFLFGSYPPGGAATAAGAFSTAFREQFGDADLDGALRDRLGPARILAPAFAALLLGSAAPTGAERLTKDSLQTCFVHAIRGLAAERTTILLIDDLHFATEDARSLFTSLAMAVPGHRVLLLGTTRPGIDEKWLAGLTRLPQTSQMALHRLGPKDLARLLADSLKSEALATQLGHQIAVKSDGNPFFVFEIIRGLRDGQFLTQKDDGTWVTTRVIDDIKIPSSILDLVNARVADLTEDERALLDVASCWGFEFDPLLVGDVLGIPQIPLMRSLAQIEKKHRLVRSAGRRFVFDHHQVQEALYGAMPELLREPYHAALASALETRTKSADQDPATLEGTLCVDLCEHFLKAAQVTKSHRYLDAALSHLEKGYLNDAAIRLSESALAVPGLLAGRRRAELLLRLAEILNWIGRRPRQEECVREAERLSEAAGDDALRGQAALALGTLFYRTSRPGEAEACYRRALSLAVARGDRKAEAGATGNLGNVFYSQGHFAEARDHHERGLGIQREVGNRTGEASATVNLGNVLQAQGHVSEAREHYERGLGIFREIGDRRGEARATGNLSHIFQRLGRLPEAREHDERALEIFREIGDRGGEAIALDDLGQLWQTLGDPARARASLLASVAICREIGESRSEGFALCALGRLADDQGDPALALRLLDESLALRRRMGHDAGVADSLASIADVRLRSGDGVGDREGVRTAALEALRLSREQGRVVQETYALAVLACLPDGDVQAAVHAMTEAGAACDAIELWWLLWRATGDRAHLAAAKRILDESFANVPAEYHAAMVANVRVNREVVAACREQGLSPPHGAELREPRSSGSAAGQGPA